MKPLKTGTVLAVTALIAITTNALALEQEAGFRLRVGAPAGEFRGAVPDPGVGLSAHYGVRPDPSFTVGVGLDFLIYGSESTTYELPLVEDFDLTTTNNLAGGFLFAQYRPLTGAVQPYAEARAGFNVLWTESKLEDKDWWDDGEVARETNYDDTATYWGGGGGLLVRVYECKDEEKNRPTVFVDLKVIHLMGSEAKYLTEGDIEIVDNVPVYDASESETDLTSYELGVVLAF